MIPLKYATASQVIPLGPCLDSGDGNTEETGLTIANTDIWLWKAGATSIANKNSGGATHMQNGLYYCTLDATDTNTYGSLLVYVHESGSLYLKQTCWIMNPDAYDALLAANGTGHIEADAVAISGDSAAADNLESACDNYSATRGLSGTALPAAAADAAGGIPISDAGGLDMDAILVDTNEIQGMLPSKDYLTGTNNADGDIEADEMTGDISATITSAAISEIAAAVSTEGFSGLLNQAFATWL